MGTLPDKSDRGVHMKTKLVLLASVFTLSCSSIHQSLLSFTGVERLDIEQKSYEKPQFYMDNFNFSKLENHRKTASVVMDSDSSTNGLSRLSNRQLYFLSFYKQYLTMGKILGKDNSIESCPSFHNIILEHSDQLEKSASQYSAQINLNHVKVQNELVTEYPVLAVPYSSSKDLFSKLIDNKWQDSNSLVTKALENYYEIERKELDVLCDRGVSPSYYIYENLVQYFKNDKSFHRTRAGLKALLKVSVISNMIILDNLMDENFSIGENKFDNWLMQRSSITWIREYRSKLTHNRKSFVSQSGSSKMTRKIK